MKEPADPTTALAEYLRSKEPARSWDLPMGPLVERRMPKVQGRKKGFRLGPPRLCLR
jgi:hypothetical protein